jgi:formamidopyrimidine-DNA glycosylase
MPELPEVETIIRAARPQLVGRRITAFESRWSRNCSPSPVVVRDAIVGLCIVDLHRRGKFIIFDLAAGENGDSVGAGHLLVHLRMSGRFEWAGGNRAPPPPQGRDVRPPHTPPARARPARADQRPEPSHVRAGWTLDDGRRLLFCDARKFGRIIFTHDLASFTGVLGLEPLDAAFTIDALARVLAARRRRIKPLLLDQTVIAGLGNIYTDEALFRAGLHPLTPSGTIRRAQVAALHAAIRDVLRLGIRRNGTSIDWVYPGGRMQDHLQVYGREGEPCRRCGSTIRAIRVGQRGTHICPKCQRLPRRTQTRANRLSSPAVGAPGRPAQRPAGRVTRSLPVVRRTAHARRSYDRRPPRCR